MEAWLTTTTTNLLVWKMLEKAQVSLLHEAIHLMCQKSRERLRLGKRMFDLLKKEIKFSFRPIDQVQQTADPEKLKREYAINLEPVKRDD